MSFLIGETWFIKSAPFGGAVATDQGGFVMTKAQMFNLMTGLMEFFLRFDDEKITQANREWENYKMDNGAKVSPPLEAITGAKPESQFIPVKELETGNWKETVTAYGTRRTWIPPADNSGIVYLLQAGPFYKIGMSKDVSARIRTLATLPPFDIDLLCTIKTDDMRKLESELHERFADKRKNGEWFELDEGDVEYIKELAQ